MRRAAAVFLFLASALPALAQTAPQTCAVRVNALDIVIDPAQFADPGVTTTRRERLLNWPSRQWNRATGTPPACDGPTTLVFLANLFEQPTEAGFCLLDGGPETGLLLVPGEGNFRHRCTRTTCERVNGAANDIANMTARLGELAAAPPAPDLSTLEHATGAILVSGTRAVLRQSLRAAAGTAAAAALSSPAVLAATGVTVVGVGGAVWVCSE